MAAGPGSVSVHRPPLLKHVPVLPCPRASLAATKREPVNLGAFPTPPPQTPRSCDCLHGNERPLSAVELFLANDRKDLTRARCASDIEIGRVVLWGWGGGGGVITDPVSLRITDQSTST